MPVTAGNEIRATDFNDLSVLVSGTLGNGVGQYGYGQTVLSPTVVPGENILKAHFDAVRFDIMSVLIHQTGVIPSPVIAQVTDPILSTASAPFKSYTDLIQTARADRFTVAPSQATKTKINGSSGSGVGYTERYTATWESSLQMTLTATFADANEARYFFNSGGRYIFNTTRTGGSATSQNNSWTNTLTSAGEQEIGAATPTVNIYNLTNSYQTWYTLASSTPYSANNYKLEAKCNVADNSAGGASVFDFRITLTDDYTDDPQPGPLPDDEVNGNLDITIYEQKASGTLQPNLDPFAITAPSYTVSTITGS